MEIKRVHPFSVFKIAGLLYAIFGLFAGCIFALVSLVGGEKALPFPFGGVLAIIILPIIYGVSGAIFAAIGAALYNLVAKLVGGIKIKLEE